MIISKEANKLNNACNMMKAVQENLKVEIKGAPYKKEIVNKYLSSAITYLSKAIEELRRGV